MAGYTKFKSLPSERRDSNSHEPSQKISKPCVTAMQTLSKTRQLQIQKIFEFSLHQRPDDLQPRNLPSKKLDAFNQEIFFIQKLDVFNQESSLSKKLDTFNKKLSSHQLTHPIHSSFIIHHSSLTHSFINSTNFTLWNSSPKNPSLQSTRNCQMH
jgi:hypothetical protein